MTVEIALAFGRAVGTLFRRKGGKRRIVIGKDTRLSCYMFENALIAGLCSMGIDTLMVGPFPTPAVAFITRALRADAGIVISASHNGYRDNGIKLFSSDGYKWPDALQSELESLVRRNDFAGDLPDDDEIGRNFRISDADGRYVEFAKAAFPKHLSLKGIKLVLDCANGAAHRIAPLVFRELDAEVIAHCTAPNGLNINAACGSLYPEVIQKAVIEAKADVGIALDGDADRIVMVDEHAQVIDGDTLLAICALDMKKRGVLHRDALVATQMSNLGFLEAMGKIGIQVCQVPVGDRHVIQKMRDEGYRLGGEPSGHLIFFEHNTTSDGIVTALQVLRIMIESSSRLSELATVMKRFPQVVKNVPVGDKPPLESLPGFSAMRAKAQNRLGKSGRILVRYSGTENVCRVMVEAPQFQLAEQLAQKLAQLIETGVAASGG